jgi:type I restriction enzyme S subunit
MRNCVPANWTVARLGDLGQYHNGRAFKESDWKSTGRPIIRIQNLTGSGSETHYYDGDVDARNEAHAGDLLVSWAATLGAYIWDGPPAVINQHIFKVESLINKRFHFYSIQDALDDLYRRSHGTGMVHVTRGVFDETEIWLPPLCEQHRIVEAIESYLTRLDNAVALLERVEENLKRYRASVLKAAVEGRLVPTEAELARREGRSYEPASELLKRILAERKARWIEDAAEKARAKAEEKARKAGQPWTAAGSAATLERERAKVAKQYKEPAAPGTTDLPGLPEGWCWATMDVVTVVGPQNGIYVHKSLYGEGTPILRIDDYQADESRGTEELQRVALSDEERQRYMLREQDVIINRVNSPSHLGKSLVVESRHVPAVFESNMMRLALAKGVSPDFVQAYLSSATGKALLTANAKWAVNQASINQSDVGNTPVPLPPAAEQARIVVELDRAFSITASVRNLLSAALAQCLRLRQATLKWAFEGKLVEQDPNDEPASALLERIQAERTGAVAPKSRGRKRRSTE